MFSSLSACSRGFDLAIAVALCTAAFIPASCYGTRKKDAWMTGILWGSIPIRGGGAGTRSYADSSSSSLKVML